MGNPPPVMLCSSRLPCQARAEELAPRSEINRLSGLVRRDADLCSSQQPFHHTSFKSGTKTQVKRDEKRLYCSIGTKKIAR